MSEFSRRRSATYIACAVIVSLGLPVGAFAAVAGSNMFITDAGTGYKAHVNRYGQLLTSTTGAVKVSNLPSTQNVRQTMPLNVVAKNCFDYSGSCTIASASATVWELQTVTVGCYAPNGTVTGAAIRYTGPDGFKTVGVPLDGHGSGQLEGPLYVAGGSTVEADCGSTNAASATTTADVEGIR